MVTLHICDLDCEASMRYGEIGREEQSERLTGAGDFRRHHFSAMISRGCRPVCYLKHLYFCITSMLVMYERLSLRHLDLIL